MTNRPKPRNIQEKELFEILEESGMTYADLARRLGVSRDYISKIIQHKRPITKKIILKLIKEVIHDKDNYTPR